MNVLFHFFKVCAEKPTDSLTEILLPVMRCYSITSCKIVFVFWQLNHNMSLYRLVYQWALCFGISLRLCNKHSIMGHRPMDISHVDFSPSPLLSWINLEFLRQKEFFSAPGLSYLGLLFLELCVVEHSSHERRWAFW